MIVLITGATSGIGRALVDEYIAAGARVIAHGRTPLPDTDLPSTIHGYIRGDLSIPIASPQPLSLADKLRRPPRKGVKSGFAAPPSFEGRLDELAVDKIDVLIHNAAVGWVGDCRDQPRESVDELIRVNLLAPIAITRSLIDRVAAPNGVIVFISSVAAILPAPKYAVYAATKAALEGFARSLRIEQSGRRSVLVIRPGATRTGMHEKAGLVLTEDQRSKFADPRAVARQIRRAVTGSKRTSTLGLTSRLLRAFCWAFPAVAERMASRR